MVILDKSTLRNLIKIQYICSNIENCIDIIQNTWYYIIVMHSECRKERKMEKNFTINDIISIFLRRLWVIIVLAIVGGGMAYIYSQFVIPKKYTSTVSMYVYNQIGERSLAGSDFTFAQKLVETYIVILKSNQVLEAVSEGIVVDGLDYDAKAIRGMITAQAVAKTEVLDISVACENAQHAQIIANKISIVAPPEIIRVVKAGSVEVVDKAQVSSTHSSPNIPQNTIIGVILGMALAFALAFLLELMNTSIKDKTDLTEAFGLPVLTMVPNLSDTQGKSGYSYYKYKYEYGYENIDVEVDENSSDGGADETSK